MSSDKIDSIATHKNKTTTISHRDNTPNFYAHTHIKLSICVSTEIAIMTPSTAEILNAPQCTLSVRTWSLPRSYSWSTNDWKTINSLSSIWKILKKIWYRQSERGWKHISRRLCRRKSIKDTVNLSMLSTIRRWNVLSKVVKLKTSAWSWNSRIRGEVGFKRTYW